MYLIPLFRPGCGDCTDNTDYINCHFFTIDDINPVPESLFVICPDSFWRYPRSFLD